MSYPVAAADLGRALEQYAEGYLLTVTTDATTRAVAVRPRLVDGRVVVGAGRSSSANVTANPAVTVLCPPSEEKGFTLLIDGTATVEGDEIRIEPASVVLHRPPYSADGPPPPDYAGGKAVC
ncbi:hypothetical protein [Nocardioides sp. CER19]|uniref:hypothetical protein n=1 Tax=Nocardioides sp. CER19 TaxID=3038538 RepID=UPI00244A4336|nr:hypothetical protein [Nocardioides sp. CER19]MDH2414882.1 hypothetical protein [Nocardioides sp. CER19]